MFAGSTPIYFSTVAYTDTCTAAHVMVVVVVFTEFIARIDRCSSRSESRRVAPAVSMCFFPDFFQIF